MLKRARGQPIQCSLAKASERFLRRQIELEDSSPFDAAPAARAEHAARMSEAQGTAAVAESGGDWRLDICQQRVQRSGVDPVRAFFN